MIRLLLAEILLLLAFPFHGLAQSKNNLVGTWRLVSAKDTTDAGEVRDSYGANPTGFLTYTADGRMMAIIANGGRKSLSVADRISAPMEERAEAYSTFLAYAGTYSLSPDKVVHHVQVHSTQNLINTDFVRFIEKLEANRVVLRTPPFFRGGVHMTYQELVWERWEEKKSEQ